jgi:hypothetical protein
LSTAFRYFDPSSTARPSSRMPPTTRYEVTPLTVPVVMSV